MLSKQYYQMTIVLFLYANKQNGIALLISIREGKSQREQKI